MMVPTLKLHPSSVEVLVVFVRDAVFIKMVPTIVGGASKLKAHLTLRS
jgi:hypothetical protein